MTVSRFSLTPLPQILFGPGKLAESAATIARRGHGAPLLTGERAFTSSERWPALLASLNAAGLTLAQAGLGSVHGLAALF